MLYGSIENKKTARWYSLLIVVFQGIGYIKLLKMKIFRFYQHVVQMNMLMMKVKEMEAPLLSYYVKKWEHLIIPLILALCLTESAIARYVA